MEGRGQGHCLGVPVRWRIQCRKDVTRRLRGHRTQCLPGRRRLWGAIHSKHDGVRNRSAWLEFDQLAANGGRRSGKAGFGRQVRTRAQERDRNGSQAARHRHAKVHLECGRDSDGDSRLDQCGTSHSCHRESCSGQMDVGRLRGRPAEGRPSCAT